MADEARAGVPVSLCWRITRVFVDCRDRLSDCGTAELRACERELREIMNPNSEIKE